MRLSVALLLLAACGCESSLLDVGDAQPDGGGVDAPGLVPEDFVLHGVPGADAHHGMRLR